MRTYQGRQYHNSPGPGQELGTVAIGITGQLLAEGNTIDVWWVPAHQGVEGKELAGQRAGDAAAHSTAGRPRAQ